MMTTVEAADERARQFAQRRESASLSEPVPASWRIARRAVAALFFMNGVLFANWVSRIPAVQAERSMSDGVLGAALLCVGLGALAAMPMAGWASGRFGSDRVSRWSALAYCALLPAVAVAPGVVLFVAALFCFGAAHGALDVAMNAQAVEVERHYPEPILSSVHALFSLGGLVGAVIGGVVATAGLSPGVHFSVLAVVLAILAAGLILPRLRSDERGLVPVASEPKPATFPRPSRAVGVLGIIAFCVLMGEGAMADWSALFLSRVVGAGEGIAAAGYAAFSIAMAVGRFSGDRLVVCFGPVRLVRWGGVLAAGGLALALMVREPLVSLVGFAAVGAGFATVVPQVFSAAGRQGGASGAAVAAVTTIGYLGFLIGPPLLGGVAEIVGLQRALAVVVVTSLLFAFLARGVGTASRVRGRSKGPCGGVSGRCAG
jgi:predicted MFS family arabinose efflux permease